MNKIVNMDGDLEILRDNLEKEKSILEILDQKNFEVSKKIEDYKNNKDESVWFYSIKFFRLWSLRAKKV